MAIYKFPEGDNQGGTRHKPEFIVVDEFEEARFEKSGPLSSIQQLNQLQAPFTLRLFFLMGAILMALVSIVLVTATAFLGLVSLLALRKSDTINHLFAKVLTMCQKVIVFALGLFVAVFSLTFGIGMIILFFFLRGEALDSDFLNRLTKLKSH